LNVTEMTHMESAAGHTRRVHVHAGFQGCERQPAATNHWYRLPAARRAC
jgi:hypothetical protein